jgi:hypothetical protein
MADDEKTTNLLAQIDVQIEFLRRCRSVFPRLGNHLVGQAQFEAPEYYRQHGHHVSVNLGEQLSSASPSRKRPAVTTAGAA